MDLNHPLIGGLLIGTSAALLLLGNGRIAGISGICWAALSTRTETAWRWLFIAGIIVGAALYHRISGLPIPAPPEASLVVALASGLLVGFGVHWGSGCTSGHGVCGLGRRSPRSLTATVTFMTAGVITVAVARHILGAPL